MSKCGASGIVPPTQAILDQRVARQLKKYLGACAQIGEQRAMLVLYLYFVYSHLIRLCGRARTERKTRRKGRCVQRLSLGESMCILRIASREDVHMTCPDTLDPIIGRVHCRFSAIVEEVEEVEKVEKILR